MRYNSLVVVVLEDCNYGGGFWGGCLSSRRLDIGVFNDL